MNPLESDIPMIRSDASAPGSPGSKDNMKYRAPDTPAMDEVSDRYRPAAVEAAVAEYWDEVGAYDAAKAAHRDDPEFYFLDGPPYTNGSPHMGHAWNKSLKDCYIRQRRMLGYDVEDRPGYDMHGLPIETQVEERLGFSNKQDILQFGEEAFIEECKSFAEEHLEILQDAFVEFGVWMDWDDPYKTLDPEYMEAAWWAFKQAHGRGLVEQGPRSISHCPRCETAIAKNEVEFEDVTDPSIYVALDLVDRDGALVIWTTTPWTLPANTFVAVDEDGEYVAIETTVDGDSTRLYLAEPKLEEVCSVAGITDYDIVERLTGEELRGWEYRHPLADEVPDHPDSEGTLQVYNGEYVEVDGDGTGLVHSAPGHGEEDFARGQELDLPVFCPVGEDGVFTDAAGRYADEFVKEADKRIIEDLEANGAMLATETIHHSYGHCWRCDTGIIQIVTEQWLITVTDVKSDLLANIGESEWYPSWARDNRFRDFVEDAPDWNVSRQRYWGIPIPIWLPPAWDGDMANAIVIGDRQELAERVDQDIDPDAVDLHKPVVDALTITEGEETYRRVPDVFDVWLDSSVAPWGSVGYPASTEAHDRLWPADLIIEAHDQTRGWFWSMLGMGTAAVNQIPYEQVLMYGHALMPDGRAMSKSKGLIVDPYEAIERNGRDVTRLVLLSHNPQGEDMRFSWDAMDETERRLNILWNVARFPLPYMELDGVCPADLSLADYEEDLELIDRWVLSRLQTVTEEVTEDFTSYRQDRAIDRVLGFIVEDVSRYYVQAVRERMWLEENAPEKLAAYATIARVIDVVTRLLAPVAPFIVERVYRFFFNREEVTTIHALDWPSVDASIQDPTLEAQVDVLRDVEEAAATARQQVGRKLRWPVGRIVVETDSDAVSAAVQERAELLADRVNAKAVHVVDPAWEELSAVARPNMEQIGPAYGAQAAQIMEAVDGAPVDEIEAGLTIDGEVIALTEEMYAIDYTTPEEIGEASFAGGTVYVDSSLTPELEAEGYARETVRRIQEMRKSLDLEIDEPIHTSLTVDDERVEAYLDEWEEYIATETRTESFVSDATGLQKTWQVEDIELDIGIQRLHTS